MYKRQTLLRGASPGTPRSGAADKPNPSCHARSGRYTAAGSDVYKRQVKIRERYRASTYAQWEETASGDSNRVKEKRFLSFIALGNAVLADEFLARAYNKPVSYTHLPK